MSIDARRAAFHTEAADRFRFLVARFGFQESAELEEGLIGFTAAPWQIWISLDEYNQTVDTYVIHDRDDAGHEPFRAPLHAILTTMGLPAQWAPTSAQTRQGMVTSLTTQAETLGKVMPTLLGADGLALMVRASD